MKKSLTTAAMLAIIAAGSQVHADQINGQHVTPTDQTHATGDDGSTWINDGGTWWHNTEAHESGTLAPDAPQIEVPQPVEIPETPETPRVETPTPTEPQTPQIDGGHLDAPEHHETQPAEPMTTPQVDGVKQTEPDATDPTDDSNTGSGSATITITEPKTQDVTEAHKSAPADIEKLAIKDIEKAQNDAQAKPQAATATPKAEAVPTTLGTVTKSIDTATPAPVYQAKGTPLPATGEGDTTADMLAGIGSIAGAAALALYLQRKGA